MPSTIQLSIPANNNTAGHATTQTSLFVYVPSTPSTNTALIDYNLSGGSYFRLSAMSTGHARLEFSYTGYGSATVDLGVLPASTWTWISFGFATSGGLYVRGDITPLGGGTSTVQALASSGTNTGTTLSNVDFGVGVARSSSYSNFPNNAAGNWLMSKLIIDQITSNTSTGNPRPTPSTDFAALAMADEYLAHDPLGAATQLIDDGTGGNTLSAGSQGLTIVNNGPPLQPQAGGPGGAHEGDISIYESGQWTTLHIGTTGQELTVQSGYPAWTNGSLAILTTEGDLLYYHSGGLTRLPIGTNGLSLGSNGTDPIYQDAVKVGPTRWEPVTDASGSCLVTNTTDPVMALAVNN